MGLENLRRGLSRFLILAIVVSTFTIVASGQGYCDIQFTGSLPNIQLPSLINVSPNPVSVGQTVTVKGSGWNTTAYPGDPYPMVACSIGPGPVKINTDGTWSLETSFTGAGTRQVYAQDKWGHTSNTVNLTIVELTEITFTGTVYNGSTSSTDTNGGIICIKYPASMDGHYEQMFYGSTYTYQYPYNGTAVEVWAIKGSRVSQHESLQNLQAGQTYFFNLILPTPTPAVSPTSGPTPTQSSSPTATPGQTVSPTAVTGTLDGPIDATGPQTVLSLTGIEDSTGAFTTNVVCTLQATDNAGGSGVSNITYSFDGNNWTTYTGPFTISTPGNHTVFYRSTDYAGNQDLTKVKAFTLVGSASATPGDQQGQGLCAAMLLPLLLVGFAGIYSIRKRQ